MVERTEEEDPFKQRKDEAKEPRQEAMVKGIPTGRPAPMPVERSVEALSQENWLTKVLGWFRPKAPEPAPQPAPVRTEAPRGGRGRQDRDRRGNQRDEHRVQPREGREGARDQQREGPKPTPAQGAAQSPRRDREPREGQRNEPRNDAREGPRDVQKQRPPREPRPMREPRAAADQAPAITQPQPGAVKEAEHGEGGRRRRRGRGGRERGERAEQGEPCAPRGERSDRRPETAGAAAVRETTSEQAILPSAMPNPAAMVRDTENERGSSNAGFDTSSPTTASGPVARACDASDDDSPPPTHFVEIKLPPVVPVDARPALPEESIAESTPTPAHIEPEQAPAAAPTPAPPAARHAPAPPKISLELPQDSALVMVETSHQKAQTPMSEEPEAPRARRVRPPRIEVAEGPLQLVETAHKEPTPPGV